jgi:hypothetical protein
MNTKYVHSSHVHSNFCLMMYSVNIVNCYLLFLILKIFFFTYYMDNNDAIQMQHSIVYISPEEWTGGQI